jgi:hypothetical protein
MTDYWNDGFSEYNALKYCPVCAKPLEINPLSGDKACFLHGDFTVTVIRNDEVMVVFKMMRWATPKEK